MDDSSSSYNSSFYNHPYPIFTPDQSYNETTPTVSSQGDRNLNNDFAPSYHSSFDRDTELDSVGLGADGSAFDQYPTPQPQTYQPGTSYGIQAAYGDVNNWPSSDVHADPWTPTPFSYGYDHRAAGYQTTRSTTTGPAYQVNYGHYSSGWSPSASYAGATSSSNSATNAATIFSTYGQQCYGSRQQQQAPIPSTTCSQAGLSARAPAPRMALPREGAVSSPRRTERELRYPCSKCDRCFHDQSELTRHLGHEHHIADHHWQCIVCDGTSKPFERTRKDKVEDHCRAVHKQAKGREHMRKVAGSPANEQRRRRSSNQGSRHHR